MGEIGIPRREFLYDLEYWETFSIIEGYRKRDRTKLQLLAQVVYASTYMMRDAQGKTPSDMFPQLFENDDDGWEPPLSEEDRKGLIADMTRMNEESKKSGTRK